MKDQQDNPTGSEQSTDPDSPTSIFSYASQFQLPQNFELGVKRVYGASCRKPPRQDYIRSHEAQSMSMTGATITVKAQMDNAVYLVRPELLPDMPLEMKNEVRATVLVTCITKARDLFFWPIPIPSDANKSSRRWSQSAFDAAEAAKSAWIRVYANVGQGCYEWMEAKNSEGYGDPEWPEDLNLDRMIKLCFKDNVIESLDHDVLKKLMGEI